jgi:uracil-DNA glycosylase
MNLLKNAHQSWIPLLHSLAYEEPMVKFLDSLREKSIQPKMSQIFKVFEMPVEDIKVVILGQRPYPMPGTAVGRAFAVPQEIKMPTMLQRIAEELGIKKKSKWQTLDHWTDQGVFLLNTSLTIETDATSHSEEWRHFISTVITFISQENPCIWMIWTDAAKNMAHKIQNPLEVVQYDDSQVDEIPLDPKLNYKLTGNHPVTGEGFSKDGFKRVNQLLERRSITSISW